MKRNAFYEVDLAFVKNAIYQQPFSGVADATSTVAALVVFYLTYVYPPLGAKNFADKLFSGFIFGVMALCFFRFMLGMLDKKVRSDTKTIQLKYLNFYKEKNDLFVSIITEILNMNANKLIIDHRVGLYKQAIERTDSKKADFLLLVESTHIKTNLLSEYLETLEKISFEMINIKWKVSLEDLEKLSFLETAKIVTDNLEPEKQQAMFTLCELRLLELKQKRLLLQQLAAREEMKEKIHNLINSFSFN